MASWVDPEEGHACRENLSRALELSPLPVLKENGAEAVWGRDAFDFSLHEHLPFRYRAPGPCKFNFFRASILSPKTQLKTHGSPGKELCGMLHAAFTNREHWMHGVFMRPLGLVWFGMR